MIEIEIWASGQGSNAQKIIQYFEGHPEVHVNRVCSSKEGAGVLHIAAEHGIMHHVLSQADLNETGYLNDMRSRGVDLVILAGFLKLVPPHFIRSFQNRILNIHPALLPKYGGKNMYGDHVHRAVLAAGEIESGITIHIVNEKFDEGPIVAQFTCKIPEDRELYSLRAEIRALEHKHFPKVIEEYALQLGPIQ